MSGFSAAWKPAILAIDPRNAPAEYAEHQRTIPLLIDAFHEQGAASALSG